MIELLVSIGIVSLLAAIIIPAVKAARGASRRIECANNLKQLSLASHNYLDAFGHLVPTGRLLYPGLLAFGEQAEAAEQHLSRTGQPKLGGIIRCPSDPEATDVEARVSYVVNTGTIPNSWTFDDPDGVIKGISDRYVGVQPAEVTDGLSQTALFSERLVPLLGVGFNAVTGEVLTEVADKA